MVNFKIMIFGKILFELKADSWKAAKAGCLLLKGDKGKTIEKKKVLVSSLDWHIISLIEIREEIN